MKIKDKEKQLTIGRGAKKIHYLRGNKNHNELLVRNNGSQKAGK